MSALHSLRYVTAWSFVRLQRLVRMANDEAMDDTRRPRLKERAERVRMLAEMVHKTASWAYAPDMVKHVGTRLVVNDDGTYTKMAITEKVDAATEFPDRERFKTAASLANDIVEALANDRPVSPTEMRKFGRAVNKVGKNQADTNDDGTLGGLDPRKRRKLLWMAKAMCLVQDHPDWPDRRIAEEVGVHKGHLSRCRMYQAAAAMARGQGRIRQGHVNVDPETGERLGVEAHDDVS